MKKRRMPFFTLLVAVLIMAVIAVFIFISIADYSESYGEKNLREIRETLLTHIAQCYALEGRYPPDLSYLETNYGFQLNRDKYIYHYELFASNIFPDVKIFLRERADKQHEK